MENSLKALVNITTSIELSYSEMQSFFAHVEKHNGDIEKAISEIFTSFLKSKPTKQETVENTSMPKSKPVHPAAVLNWEEVNSIRNEFNLFEMNVEQLASKYNVSTSTIYNIINNNSWFDSNYRRSRYF